MDAAKGQAGLSLEFKENAAFLVMTQEIAHRAVLEQFGLDLKDGHLEIAGQPLKVLIFHRSLVFDAADAAAETLDVRRGLTIMTWFSPVFWNPAILPRQ